MVASSRIAIVASAFAVGASAAVINRRQQQDNGWLATDYQWGCSPGGCSAQFNLLGFEGVPSGAPAFDVVCSPIYIQQDWIACKNRDGSDMAPESVVYAVWKAGPDNDKQYINIAHVYYRQEDGLYYDAESASEGFLPEKGATEWFTIATVNPASESHLPPVVNSAAPTQTAQADTVETGIPDLVQAEAPVATSTDVTVPDPVPAAGEDIPAPDPTEDPAADPTATESFTPAVDPTPTDDGTPVAEPTSTDESAPAADPSSTDDGTPVAAPTSTDESAPAADPSPTDDGTPAAEPTTTGESTPTGDSTPAEDPTPAADPTPESTPSEDPTPADDPVPAPSNTVTSDMPDGLVLSQPLQSDEALAQPLQNPVPGTGTIPEGGDGA